MKKSILLLLTEVLMAGCSTTYESAYSSYYQVAVVLDYSEYTKRGFFLTEANSVSFEYQSLGSIVATVVSGHEVIGETTHTIAGTRDDIYGDTHPTVKRKVKYGDYKWAYVDDALKVLYAKAREINANGVINLKVTYTYTLTPAVIDKIIVTGMAIRKL